MARWSRCLAQTARAALVALVFCLAALPASPASGAEPPLPSWQKRLAQAETSLRGLPAGESAARETVARQLAELHAEVFEWLRTFPPAQREREPWLTEAAPSRGVEELAAEVGRLRAVLSRIAAAAGQGDSAGTFYLGRVDVAVTAETTASATTEMTPAGATVIAAADLQAYDRTALAGALELAPGVSFTRIGARNESAVYVRGFDMRQVPLFVDGIPIYTPYDGYVDLDRFTTFDVAELQVSKGFSSVLYGPNALGGAINIVSRRPAGRLEGLAGISASSGPSRSVYLNAGSRVRAFYLQGGASYLQADTFPLSDGFPPVKTQPNGDRVNAYRRDAKFNAKLGWTPNGDEYAISYVGQRGKKGNPPYAGSDASVKVRYWRWPNWDKDSVYLVSNTRLPGSSYLRGRAFYDTYDNTLYSYDDATYTTQLKSSSFRSPYKDHTIGASGEWGATLGRQTLRAAAHLKLDYHEDHNEGEPTKSFNGRIVSVGVEDTIAAGPKLSLVAGIGGDWQATTKARDYQKGQVIDLLANCGGTTGTSCGDSSGINPQAGIFYAVPSGQVRFTVSRKTRLPSLKDRYSYKLGAATPNPNLRAERNLTFEAGYQGTLGSKTSFQASAFYSRITDLIQRSYVSSSVYQLQNIGEASHSGFELDARTLVVPHLDLGANYTFLERKNISDPATWLIDAPRHKGRVSLTAAASPSVRLVVGLEYEAGRRTQNEGGKYLEVPSFVTASVKVSWSIFRQLDIEATALNAFDKYYWLSEGYPEPGQTVMAGIRYRF